MGEISIFSHDFNQRVSSGGGKEGSTNSTENFYNKPWDKSESDVLRNSEFLEGRVK